MLNMSGDILRHEAAIGTDPSRPVATTPDSDFTLTIEDAALLYERAGHPRTLRSIQRYCAKGHLEYRRVETSFAEKFLINPDSVMKHIAYIVVEPPVATGRDRSPLVATEVVASEDKESENHEPSVESVYKPRQPATEDRYIAALERENDFLRGQVAVKDDQIKDLTERARETNHLIGGLQKLLAPLLSAPDRNTGDRDHRDPLH